MPSPSYRYRVEVLRVIDGDTLECNVDLGFRVALRIKFRLAGINCPEMNTPEGQAARTFVLGLLNPLPTQLVADVVREDKYAGRWDAVLWLAEGSLNEAIVAAGHARRV